MKNSVLAIAATCALALVACGDDKGTSAPVTRSSVCASAPKLTKDCLVGEWKISEILRYNAAGVEQSPEELDAPGNLVMSSDGSFSYSHSSLGDIGGTWAISADSTQITIDGYGDYEFPSGTVSASLDSTSFTVSKSVFEARPNSSSFKYAERFTYVGE